MRLLSAQQSHSTIDGNASMNEWNELVKRFGATFSSAQIFEIESLSTVCTEVCTELATEPS